MKQPSPDLLELLTVAAQLRATGAAWERVAAQVHRSLETCRRWPRLYPEVWHRLYRQAEEDLLDEATSETAVVLRKLLRSETEKVCLDAARLLLRERQERRRLQSRTGKPEEAVDPETVHFLQHPRNLDDAKLEALLEQHLRHLSGSTGDPPVGDGPAARPS